MIIYSYVFDGSIYHFPDEESALEAVENEIARILKNAVDEDYIPAEMYDYYFDDLTASMEFPSVGYKETIFVEDYTTGSNIELHTGYLK